MNSRLMKLQSLMVFLVTGIASIIWQLFRPAVEMLALGVLLDIVPATGVLIVTVLMISQRLCLSLQTRMASSKDAFAVICRLPR